MRPPSSVARAMFRPLFSSPRRLAAGTRQSVKTISVVLEVRMPSLFSCLPTEKPGASLRMRKAEMPFAPLSLSVWKKAMMTSANPPLVVKFLVPLRT